MIQSASYPRFRWYVLLTLCIANMASAIIMIAPAPIIKFVAQDLGLDVGQATMAMLGVFSIASAFSCIIGGFLCDRFGFVKPYIASFLFLALPTLALPYVGHNLGAVMAVRIIQALGIGAIPASVSPIAAIWFPPQERGIVTGFQGMSYTLGLALGFVAAPAAFAAAGTWQGAMPWLTLICFVGLVLTIVIPFGPQPGTHAHIEARTALAADSGDFKLAVVQPVTWILLSVMVCQAWVMAAFNDLTPNYLAADSPIGVGYGAMMGGKLMMAVQIAYMVGSITTGFVMEKIFRGTTRPVIMIGYAVFAIFAVSIILPLVYGRLPVLLVCLMVAGFFQAWVIPNALAFISLHYPPHITGKLVGTAFGINLFAASAGIMLGAYALHHTGNYHISIIIVGTVAALGFVLAFFMKPPKVFVMTGEE